MSRKEEVVIEKSRKALDVGEADGLLDGTASHGWLQASVRAILLVGSSSKRSWIKSLAEDG